MGPIKYSGTFGDAELRHLLRRTLFGFTQENLSLFAGKSLDEVVETLVTPAEWPPPPVNNYDIEAKDPDVPKGGQWVTKAAGLKEDGSGQAVVDGRNNSLTGWLIKNMIAQEPTIHYKMLMFWHNHFGNSIGFVSYIKMSYQYFRTMWNFGLGDFKALIKAITIDPHMLLFLNGTANIKEAPDENYARELQELFVIGKGPNAKFTESDVQEAARVLTGWGIDWDTVWADVEAGSQFYAFQHLARSKNFSSFYGNRTIQGFTGPNGAKETDELIAMMVEHPECARFICRKLYRYFIHQDLTAEVEENFIEPLAELFIDSNFDIQMVLQSMFSSEHFYKEDLRGALIKSPLDIMVGFWRSVGVEYPTDGDPLDEDYYTHLLMMFSMADMGFYLGEPPSVSGWPAYYQIPSYDKLWLTTFSLISRIVITDGLLSDGFWTPLRRIPWDFLSYTASLPGAENPNTLIDEVARLHLPKSLTGEIRADLKNILLSGQNTDEYWTDAWLTYIANPTHQMNRETVRGRLQFFYLTFFQLPEFQLF